MRRKTPVVRLPVSVWCLAEQGKQLIRSRWLEDLFVWNRYELGSTLVGPEIRQTRSFGELPLSTRARRGLEAFIQLYPEWMIAQPYLSIKQRERRERIDKIFGDNPLVLEPRLEEIPSNLYQLLETVIREGYAPVLRGYGADLVLLKLPHFLPNSMQVDSFARLLDSWRKSLPTGKEFRLSGRGSRASQLRYELELVGKYRLFKANGFNIGSTMEAAYGLDSRKRPDLFYKARVYISRLLKVRWQLAERAFSMEGSQQGLLVPVKTMRAAAQLLPRQ
jgi:hypothetical protein